MGAMHCGKEEAVRHGTADYDARGNESRRADSAETAAHVLCHSSCFCHAKRLPHPGNQNRSRGHQALLLQALDS